MRNAEFKHLIVFSIVFLVLLIGSNAVTYSLLKSDYQEDIASLNTKINNKTGEVVSLLNAGLKNIETKTKQDINSVQKDFDSKTNKIESNLNLVKTDTEISLKQVSSQVNNLDQKNEELEDKISDIKVSSSDFSSIVQDVVKAVVSIRTDKGQGSGVIYDSRGYVLTNKHVIDGATSMEIIDYNSNKYSVQIIGYSNAVDLAVLKINSNSNFNYLEFADASEINVGSRVIAIGNPLGLSFSVTEGIISGLNRNIDSSNVGYIQTDVPINAGNSGGPLVNSNKKIIGINTLKIGNSEGLGFAIPSNTAKQIADQGLS